MLGGDTLMEMRSAFVLADLERKVGTFGDCSGGAGQVMRVGRLGDERQRGHGAGGGAGLGEGACG